MASSFCYRYHRRPDSLAVTGGYTQGLTTNDSQLVNRLMASYRRRAEAPTGLWSDFFQNHHVDIHEAILGDNRPKIETFLRNPVSSDLMLGFDSTVRSLRSSGQRIEDKHAPKLTLDALLCLAEAIGARRIENPETYFWRASRMRADEAIVQIEEVFKFQIAVPNPFPAEYGLISQRGVMSYRVPPALYQAWRIAQLLKGTRNPKVLEIGGGLGRTALYARQFGITDYTIIDIPVSSLAQGNFLGRVLGDDAIQLDGEPSVGNSADRVKLFAPRSFLQEPTSYDLILNVDSLTEIGSSTARKYWSAIQQRTKTFLSINHETNDFTVAELMKESASIKYSTRVPYWMRRGYVEELVRFVD
jgi:hypothetical protein